MKRAAALLTALLALSAFLRAEDDRFPPYDCTEEYQAFLKSKPEFFLQAKATDLPADLKWQTGMDLPEIGSPEGKKGGTFHYWIDSFPATFRFVGPDANDQFRSEHWDDIMTYIVMPHPNADGWCPGIASEWAVSADRRHVYYKLDPEATFSDGVKISVEDFFFTFFVMLSPHIQDPWYNDYYKKEFKSVTRYDDGRTFSFELPEPRPDPLWITYDFPPMPRHFFKEFGADFPARYQWRKSPTTGAYEIYPDKVAKGRSITMTRVKNWWARDRKYYRLRYNPDYINYQVTGSMDKAFELFRQGKLDFFPLQFPRLWYDKCEIEEIYRGYIERGLFYSDYPRITRGIYINTSKPLLDNLDVRLGINYSLHWKKVLEIDFRGDFSRMQSTFEGFGKFTNPKLKPIEFDAAKASEHFAKARFTKRGEDGILINDKGQRLSFTLTLPNLANYPQVCLRLKEEARRTGLEIVLEAIDSTQMFHKGDNKKHDLILAGWAASPPYPRFWEYYHSDNAWEKNPDGSHIKPKVQTNNFTMTAVPEMDPLIDRHRRATTEEEVQELSYQLAVMVQEQAAAIPAWESPWFRYGHWRWVRWPTDGNVKRSQLPLQSYVFWLDEDVRQETLKTRSAGQSFGEVTRVYDQYRKK